MFFGQKIHPLNFDIPEALTLAGDVVELSGPSVRLRIDCADILAGCWRLRFENACSADQQQYSDAVLPEWRAGRPVAPMQEADAVRFAAAAGRIDLSAAQLRLELAGLTLETVAAGIGACGDNLLLNFALRGVDGCYGFGERTRRLNKLGDSADCLTVDVVAVFRHTYARDDYDPTYVAIPFAILKAGEHFLGLFFDNPGRAVLDAGKSQPGEFWYQSFGGVTDLYALAGPTLPEVVRRYAALTGRAPLPAVVGAGLSPMPLELSQRSGISPSGRAIRRR
jgi:alpha-glucosidase